MTATTDAAPLAASASIERRYYAAMAVPFAVDVISDAIYALIHQAPEILFPTLVIASCFLLVGVGLGAWWLIRPVMRFVSGETRFEQIEPQLSRLPYNSAIVVGVLYTPMLAMRVLSHQLGISFGATLEPAQADRRHRHNRGRCPVQRRADLLRESAPILTVCANTCFRTHGVNMATFHGRFRNKVALAMVFLSFSGLILLAADIASYSGARLIREATSDIALTLTGAAFVY